MCWGPGCGCRHSLLLRYRLDKAYEYACEHPDVVVITTGGQGRDETVPEGQAMRDYLLAKGLDPDRVLQETKSTSTEENFLFARQILLDHGMPEDAAVVYVTNAFHCYRAGQYARRAGFAEVHALPAGISFFECAAVLPARGAGGAVLLGVQDVRDRADARDGGAFEPEQEILL